MGDDTPLTRRRLAALGTSLALTALVTGLGLALARNDDGSRAFFLTDRAPTLASVAEQQADASPHWLTVRPEHRRVAVVSHRHRIAVASRHPRSPVRPVLVAAAPVAGPITRYTDTTLRPGDAVMTETGIKIFAGSKTFPFTDADFTALRLARGLPRTVTTTLASLNNLPPI